MPRSSSRRFSAYAAGLLLPMLAWASGANAAKEVILHSFSGTDGAHPLGGVIVSSTKPEGTVGPLLIGTTYSGGVNGAGTIFEIRNGTLRTLHIFAEHDAKYPQSGVTEGKGRTLYGTLSAGGDTSASQDGDGGVYKMEPGGRVTILHRFHGPEGAKPIGPVILDAAGNLVGAASSGGKSTFSGTLYQTTPDGTTTALVDFSRTLCQGPIAPLAIDSSGDIVSTAWMSPQNPYGCIWKYSPTGAHPTQFKDYTTLHKFNNGEGGREPRGGVVVGADGSLYGANYYSGNFGPGTLFKLAPDGTEVALHHFKCDNDGGYPFGTLLSDGKGLLFGTTSGCGAGGGGVVFSYDIAKAEYRVLHAFSNDQVDGYLPIGPLSMDNHGNLYGVTEYGGPDNLGIVYEIVR